MQESYIPQAQEQAASLRMFAGSLSTALGMGSDQNWLDEDATISSPVGTHVIFDPYRGSVVQGTTQAIDGGIMPSVGQFVTDKKGKEQGIANVPVGVWVIGLGLLVGWYLHKRKG